MGKVNRVKESYKVPFKPYIQFEFKQRRRLIPIKF